MIKSKYKINGGMNMNTAMPTAEQIKSVKAKGFLINRGTSMFSGRIITENGILTADQMSVLSEAANKFGNGSMTFTVRLTVELPGIEFDNIEPFREFVAKAGMQTGGTGAKVRPIVACKGTTCIFGLCDTQAIAKEIHKLFFEGYFDVVLPHKFKIAVGGCPNNCAKPDLNDIGIVGQRVVKVNYDSCRGCKKCGMQATCPMGALSFVDGKITTDKTICNNCGRCLSKCPFKIANEYEDKFKIYIGGRWGKKIRLGSVLNGLFNKDEALNIVEKTILLFKSEGEKGERFGMMIDRLGKDYVECKLLSNELLDNKTEILKNDGTSI